MTRLKRLSVAAFFTAAAAVGLAGSATAQQSKELIVDRFHKDQVVEAPKPKLNKDALNKLGWKLGTQAYTWRHASLMETIDMAGDLGLMYIEFYPGQRFSKESEMKADHNTMTDAMIQQVKEKLKARGLTAHSYGVVSVGGNEAETRKVMAKLWAKIQERLRNPWRQG